MDAHTVNQRRAEARRIARNDGDRVLFATPVPPAVVAEARAASPEREPLAAGPDAPPSPEAVALAARLMATDVLQGLRQEARERRPCASPAEHEAGVRAIVRAIASGPAGGFLARNMRVAYPDAPRGIDAGEFAVSVVRAIGELLDAEDAGQTG